MANRDLKNASRATRGRSSSSSKGGGMIAGIIIGLIVGVAVAVGLAMYMNRSSTPFTNLDKHTRQPDTSASHTTELLAPGTRIADAASATVTVPAATAPVETQPVSSLPSDAAAKPVTPPSTKPGKDDQRFDFYKILPGQVDAVTADTKADKEPSSAPVAKMVYLQLGAFQNQDEADNLKAKLALLGVEAKIFSVNMPDKGMVHRVRVGPYSRQEDMDRVKAQLKQDGISASVVRAE